MYKSPYTNLREPEVTKLYKEYCKLNRRDILNLIDKETNGKLGIFLKLYKQLIKKKGMSIEQVVNVVDIAIHKLPYMENLYRQAKDQAEKMQCAVQRLANDIRALEHKISILDRIAISLEQDCRRKYQEIQELNAQKDRIEKWTTNVLNGEDYSKIRQFIKENVKAILSDNKILLSLSFAALIQTLKADPQMVKLIQNTPSVNDGEQHKDDNNNITKYIESNKDRILALTQKNYENLVEVLTNNVINTYVSSASNPTSSVPQSSHAFLNPYDQADACLKEESESFHIVKAILLIDLITAVVVSFAISSPNIVVCVLREKGSPQRHFDYSNLRFSNYNNFIVGIGLIKRNMGHQIFW